jgi:hypothetical protein
VKSCKQHIVFHHIPAPISKRNISSKKNPRVEEEEAEDNGMTADNVICGRTYPSRGSPTSSAL